MKRIPLKSVINPFRIPNPDNEKTKNIVAWIDEKIKSRSLDFNTCMEKIEELVNLKDVENTEIAMYYITNIIINTREIPSIIEKQDIINGLFEELKKIK